MNKYPRLVLGVSLISLMLGLAVFLLLIFIHNSDISSLVYNKKIEQTTSTKVDAVERFPVSVNPKTKNIEENPVVDWYVGEHLSINIDHKRKANFIDRILATLAESRLFQQLASSISRIVVIYPGERREEVVKHIGDILGWTEAERLEFSILVTTSVPALDEGKFFPGKYTLERLAKPEVVAEVLNNQFTNEVYARYDSQVASIVPIGDAITIASLLEREAYNFTDMRIISGIIWNRLFINMPLQLDATLQYVKGSRTSENKWWPAVNPADKFLESPYNTYQEVGLPPGPIASPSLEAIVAALNPVKTDCLFYFHATDGTFYCSPTYEGHVTLLKQVYGRGS